MQSSSFSFLFLFFFIHAVKTISKSVSRWRCGRRLKQNYRMYLLNFLVLSTVTLCLLLRKWRRLVRSARSKLITAMSISKARRERRPWVKKRIAERENFRRFPLRFDEKDSLSATRSDALSRAVAGSCNILHASDRHESLSAFVCPTPRCIF